MKTIHAFTSSIASVAMAFAAGAALAQDSTLRANVLVVESVEDFQRWVQQQLDPAAPRSRFPPSLKEIPAAKKVHFPILVFGLAPPTQGVMALVADVEFFGPDGRSIGAAPQCCRYTITNRPDIRMAMLGNTLNLELDSGDASGVYTVRAVVSNGSQKATASETFQFVSAKAPSPARDPAAAPRLRMGTTPARNPGANVDKRDCLALPTPAEVIKCTERK